MGPFAYILPPKTAHIHCGANDLAIFRRPYVSGISTRKVDALVAALGVQSGISRSQVSRICTGIDVQVQAFLNRPLEEGGYAYVYLDATYLHGRLGKALQVCSRAVVVAMGVNADGRRELLGLKVGDSETEGFWSEFLVSLKQRGLSGVKLVISDAHVGLTKAWGCPDSVDRYQGSTGVSVRVLMNCCS